MLTKLVENQRLSIIMGNKNKNNRAESFLDSIPKASIEEPTDTLAQKSKFNFAYFINDNTGQDFRD